MRVVDLYKLAIKLLKRQQAENPQKKFTSPSGEVVYIGDIVNALEKVVSWIHPELSSDDIAKVVRCNRCKHYKTYRKKGAFKPQTFKACCLDMRPRDPMFFCKDGEERS